MFGEPYGIQLSRLFRSLNAKVVTEDVETLLYMKFYILLLSHYLTNTKETEVNGMVLSFKAKRKKKRVLNSQSCTLLDFKGRDYLLYLS